MTIDVLKSHYFLRFAYLTQAVQFSAVEVTLALMNDE